MNTPPTPNIVMVGAPPPPSGNGITIEENTTGFCSVDGTIDNNNAGFTGAGFANANNAANSGINWRITTPANWQSIPLAGAIPMAAEPTGHPGYW